MNATTVIGTKRVTTPPVPFCRTALTLTVLVSMLVKALASFEGLIA